MLWVRADGSDTSGWSDHPLPPGSTTARHTPQVESPTPVLDSCLSTLRLGGLALLFGLLLGVTAPATAQVELKLGLKEGGHFGTFGGENEVRAVAPELGGGQLGRRPGFVIGGLAIMDPGVVAVQSEVLWIWKGAKVTANETTTTAKLNYLEVPVLARYQLPLPGLPHSLRNVQAHLLGGPTFGVTTSAEREEKTTTGGRTTLAGRTDLAPIARSFDIGMALGFEVGYEFSDKAMLMMDVRYQRSFTTALDGGDEQMSVSPEVYHQGMALTLGWIYSPGWSFSFD